MEQAAFVRAILDEPEDDTPRLVFADWLQDHDQEARAAWIRASCALARADHDDPDFGELVDLEQEAFRRCRPAWWQRVTGVSQVNDRGMFRFGVRSKTAAARLGKARWLGEAAAEGWLEAIAVEWCDGSVARVIAGWSAEARQVPLLVRPARRSATSGWPPTSSGCRTCGGWTCRGTRPAISRCCGSAGGPTCGS